MFQTHDADLVISTWMGSQLYLYILDDAPRLRDIKATLRENSRDGIGTLFLIPLTVLPDESAVLRLPDWQDALVSLNKGFIYAYHVNEAGEPNLTQVHYEAAEKRGEFRVWYARDFDIETVNVQRRVMNEGIRGTWYVGDIASQAYKRRVKSERANQRFHYQTKYTQDIPNRGGRGNGRKSAFNDLSPKQAAQEVLAACELLGIPTEATHEQAKQAFRQRAMQVHPDVSALPRNIADQRFKELNHAFETIKAYHGWN